MKRPDRINKVSQHLEDKSWFEMTNILQEITGLPCIIWISSKRDGHQPTIKVQGDHSKKLNPNLLFTFSILSEASPTRGIGNLTQEDIDLVKQFIELNKNVLLDYWNEVDIDVVSIISKLQKVA